MDAVCLYVQHSNPTYSLSLVFPLSLFISPPLSLFRAYFPACSCTITQTRSHIALEKKKGWLGGERVKCMSKVLIRERGNLKSLWRYLEIYQ